MPEQTTELSTLERNRLEKCEQDIERGAGMMSHSFQQVRDDKLYRETAPTFAHYCEMRWSTSVSQVNRIIQHGKVLKNLAQFCAKGDPASQKGAQALPSLPEPTASQACELNRVPAESQGEVWQEAVETAPEGKGGKPAVTAAHVAQTRDKRTQRQEADDGKAPETPPKPNGRLTESCALRAADAAIARLKGISEQNQYRDVAFRRVRLWIQDQPPAVDPKTLANAREALAEMEERGE